MLNAIFLCFCIMNCFLSFSFITLCTKAFNTAADWFAALISNSVHPHRAMFHLYCKQQALVLTDLRQEIILLGACTPYNVTEENKNTYHQEISQENRYKFVTRERSSLDLIEKENVRFFVSGQFESKGFKTLK